MMKSAANTVQPRIPGDEKRSPSATIIVTGGQKTGRRKSPSSPRAKSPNTLVYVTGVVRSKLGISKRHLADLPGRAVVAPARNRGTFWLPMTALIIATLEHFMDEQD